MEVASVTNRHLREMVLCKRKTQCLQILWNRFIRVYIVRVWPVISYLKYIICGLSVVLIFFGIFVGIQYAGNTKIFLTLPIPPKNWVNDVGLNDTYTCPNPEKILQETKLKIKSKFLKYNFRHYEDNLEDLLMETGGIPIRSLIISTWRSGTTFLGEVLNTIPNTFYHYEPLAYHGVVKIRDPPQAVGALRTIKNLFKCKYENMPEYFSHGKRHDYLFKHNKELWSHCINNMSLCLNANFMSSFCRLFPIQTMKLLRIRLHFIQEILEEKALNLKVFLLVRDPRGVMQSRTNVSFCQWSCRQPEVLCADMVSDYFAAIRLLPKYPDSFMVLRYEELAAKPKITISEILKFLKLRVTTSVEEYLELHTTIEGIGFDTTYRKSKDVPYKWKTILDYNYVDKIQTACKEAMELWGYRMAHNASHMASHHFNPIADYTFRP